jgi:HlyD family secretion protein
MNVRRILLIVLILGVLGGGGYWYYTHNLSAQPAALAASGTMETTQVSISPEVGGRVMTVNFKEGDAVKAGDVLVTFDTTLLQAQRTQAEAALAAAQANYDSLESGATRVQLQAAVAAAQQQVLAAQQALQDLHDQAAVTAAQAQTAVAAAQSALTQAKKQVGYAQHPVGHTLTDAVRDSKVALDAAQANAQLATVSQPVQAYTNNYWLTDFYWKRYQDLKAKYDANPNPDALTKVNNAYADYQQRADQQAQYQLTAQTDQSLKNNAVLQAQQAYSDAVRNLNSALAGPDADKLAVAQANELLAEATLKTAQDHATKVGAGPDPDALAAAQARLEAAQAGLTAAQAALAPPQLDAAKAQLDAAKAALNLLTVQLGKLTVAAPSDGVILSRAVEPGEVANAGATLMVIGPLTELQVTVYVPENLYGQIKVGQTARLSVDSFPGRVFEAKVLQIANQAQYTPRNTQTVQGRSDTVFAVKLDVPNPDLALKPGMPADVSFAE